jgi:hypothetical protein
MQQTGDSMVMGGAVMSAAITAPFIALMATSRQAAVESRTAVGQVEAALASMGNAAGRSQRQLEEQAKALQALSIVDDDDILRQVTANLLTFGKVSGEVFDRAQMAALNMSARLEGGLQGATMLLGKALQDPVKGMTALTRAGVSLDEGAKKNIRSLVEQGRLFEAQVILLREVETQFNGAAKAQRDADPDAATRDAWREMQETLGEIALNVLPPLTLALTAAMEAFNRLSPEMQATVVGGIAIAAALGPVVTVLGGLMSAGGAVVGMLARIGPQLTGGATATTLLGRSMVALRSAMMFLVTTPWGLLITGVAVAVGLLVTRTREATPTQRALGQATDALTAATDAYEKAVLEAAAATGDAKESALEQVRALRVLQEEKRRTALRAIELAKAELAQAAAARAAYNTRLTNAGEGMGTFARVQSGGPGLVPEHERRATEAAIGVLEGRIAEADRRIAAIDAGMNAPLGGGAVDLSNGSGRRAAGPSAEQLAQEAEQRRRAKEDMEHEVSLEEARLTNNHELVRSLEREGAVRQRTRALIDAGILKDDEAAAEAERVQKRLDAAQEVQLAREEEADRRQLDRQLWEIDGRQDMINKIERQELLEQRIAFWQERGRDLISATSIATSELLEFDLARANAAERAAKAAKASHDLELARLRGDRAEVWRLSREAEIAARAWEYQTRSENPLDPEAARRLAEREVSELDDAEMTGRVRDFVKEGWQAAMDGDLSDFARKWVMEWAGRGLEDALNDLADLLANIFRNIDWGGMSGQGGSGGGFDWGKIGSAVSGWFKRLPGFKDGGSILPGGWGGIDSQLVQFRKSPNERVDIYTPGNDTGPSGSPVHFDLRGAVLTPDLLLQMEAMASASGGAAVRGARAAVPADQAKAGRYTRGRY